MGSTLTAILVRNAVLLNGNGHVLLPATGSGCTLLYTCHQQLPAGALTKHAILNHCGSSGDTTLFEYIHGYLLH